ncbi:hypothetical protein MMC12_008265 [Toensbergia leucococca]|nr:hypothetical protein [Toensbergia leucococca]
MPSSSANSSHGDGLCDECSRLNLERSFADAFALYEGARRGRNNRKLAVYRSDVGPEYLGHFHYVTSLNDRLSGAISCKLCIFLKQTCPRVIEGSYKLMAICASESYLFDVPKKSKQGRPERRPWGEVDHNVFMALVPELPLIPKTGVPLRWFETDLPTIGSIYRLSQWTRDERMRLAFPRVVKAKADLKLGKSWLEGCRQNHKSCVPNKLAAAPLPGFRVINCTRTPPVVEERPSMDRYVALSYVWGSSTGDWPDTILDAVEVTKQLGEQYLWVDRLCIDQSNLKEKNLLISKMDAIYEGAEFTIIAAAGDAKSGLPGVTTKPRKPQPLVKLKDRIGITSVESGTNLTTTSLDRLSKLLGITIEEAEVVSRDREWLDPHRFGIDTQVVFDDNDMEEIEKSEKIMEKYNISYEHLKVFQGMADEGGDSLDEFMAFAEQLSQAQRIPIQELIPSMLKSIAVKNGVSACTIDDITARPVTSSSKVERPLPPGRRQGITTLISTLEDPRVTLRNSEWAERGWTYQEGVLSKRRLVFSDQQMYWECNCMTMHESLHVLGCLDSSGARYADYMLSGIFDGDLHRVPKLQYGFNISGAEEVSKQVLKLVSHICAFTSRNLSYDSDSLNAFLGIAAKYSSNSGLCVLLGMPVWASQFATERPGLQDTFALSISGWTHAAQRLEKDAEMYVVNCPRRSQFPSWTWVGWKGRVNFSGTMITEWGTQEDKLQVDFFDVMTSNVWATSIDRLWSAEMVLHSTDGSEATLLVGQAPVADIATDQSKSWLLTIRGPRVLRHMFLMHSTIEDDWRRLMGRRVQLHLSVSITEEELVIGHKSGELATVLVFATTVPFIWNGTARFLILRKADDSGMRWERIGRLAMTLEEREMDKYTSLAEMIDSLPVKPFGRDIILI